MFILFLFCADGGEKRTYADTGRSQIIYLVNLQAGINLAASLQNFVNLVCSNGVQAAAEGIKLDEIQIILCLDKVGCRVQTGMIHPLVVDTERTLDLCQVGYRILCQYSNAVAVDQIRDTVMDLGINVIRTAGKDNSSSSCLFQILQSFLPFF